LHKRSRNQIDKVAEDDDVKLTRESKTGKRAGAPSGAVCAEEETVSPSESSVGADGDDFKQPSLQSRSQGRQTKVHPR
jgi:hypothetical protein